LKKIKTYKENMENSSLTLVEKEHLEGTNSFSAAAHIQDSQGAFAALNPSQDVKKISNWVKMIKEMPNSSTRAETCLLSHTQIIEKVAEKIAEELLG
jgi:hypothetical protein